MPVSKSSLLPMTVYSYKRNPGGLLNEEPIPVVQTTERENRKEETKLKCRHYFQEHQTISYSSQTQNSFQTIQQESNHMDSPSRLNLNSNQAHKPRKTNPFGHSFWSLNSVENQQTKFTVAFHQTIWVPVLKGVWGSGLKWLVTQYLQHFRYGYLWVAC